MDRASATEPSRGEGVSPSIAFIVGLVLIAALAGAWMLARPENPTAVTGKPSGVIEEPDYSLTNAEAIARFRELDALSVKAYRMRDADLLGNYLTSSSPLLTASLQDIKKLLRDDTRFVPTITTRWLEVRKNTPRTIVIRQDYVERILFRSEDGTSLGPSKKVHYLVDWTLQLQGSEWKVHNSKVISSEVVR